jgi:hypothetical protein
MITAHSSSELLSGNAGFKMTLKLPIVKLIELVNQAYETGAIHYWAEEFFDGTRAERGVFEHPYCYKFEVQAEEGDRHEIDVNTISTGIQLILNGAEEMIQARGYVIKALAEDDLGYIDSDVLDQIIQAGLFGELIYG